MSEVTNDLIYEVLKNLQESMALMRGDIDGIKTRITSVDTKIGLVHTDMAHLSDRMDKIDLRMGRVETRLNLSEEQQ